VKARQLAPLLFAFLIVQRLLELRLARANERWARQQGAVEYGREHYPLFFVLHPTWMLALLREGRRSGGRVQWPMLALFVLAQPLRYWVIRTLGRYWNTRILIVPGGKRVTGGPFRLIPHPNYAVVALEIAAAPLAVGAWRTATAYTVLNAALLLLVRLPAENAALKAYQTEGQQPTA
jgi:methyltransferase